MSHGAARLTVRVGVMAACVAHYVSSSFFLNVLSNRVAVLSLPVYSQMEFIDVSQMSFIHDLGPKGL